MYAQYTHESLLFFSWRKKLNKLKSYHNFLIALYSEKNIIISNNFHNKFFKINILAASSEVFVMPAKAGIQIYRFRLSPE